MKTKFIIECVLIIGVACFLLYKYRGNIKRNVIYYFMRLKNKNQIIGKEYEKNPVYGSKDIGSVFDPYVLMNNKKYIMYLSYRKDNSISVLESDNGIEWNEKDKCLLANKLSGWEDQINRCTIVPYRDFFYMYYTGQARGFSWIGIAESKDGFKFRRCIKNPVLMADRPYEKQSVMNPCVLFDCGIWKMWYSAGETYEPDCICYAESEDGVNWKKSEINPIIVSENYYYEKCKVGVGEVKKYKGYYIMLYIGYSTVDSASVCMMISKDGITNWKRVSFNPIIKKGSFFTWKANSVYRSTFEIIEGKMLIWYNGRRRFDERIGYHIIDDIDTLLEKELNKEVD